MIDPYAVIDADYDKMYDMVDPAEKCRESIIEQLLTKEGVASYYDKEGNHQRVFLVKILEDYAEEIEAGKDTKWIIEAEAKRIAESIF